jgi:hypothetical protein
MVWPFSRREYDSRKVLGLSVPHSHAVENAVSTAVSYTPIGIAIDVVSGNGADNPLVGGLYPPTKPAPPPDTRPTCNSYKETGLTAIKLLNFDTAPDCQGVNTLTSWLLTERNTFCADVNNYTKNPGGLGGSCSERDTSRVLAEAYCRKGANIKTNWCNREYLGDSIYAELAAAYCKTDDGKAHQWCTCYNVKGGVCDTDPNAAGCAAKALTFDPLVANTPEFFKSMWTGREGCFGAVCTESDGQARYLPIDETNVCASPINICGGVINASNINASSVTSKCTIGDNTFDPNTGELLDPDGNPADNPNEDPDEDGNFFTKYFPTSLADLTGDDTNKKIGAGASVSSSLLCCICLIIVIVMLSSGGGNSGGSSRFRR